MYSRLFRIWKFKWKRCIFRSKGGLRFTEIITVFVRTLWSGRIYFMGEINGRCNCLKIFGYWSLLIRQFQHFGCNIWQSIFFFVEPNLLDGIESCESSIIFVSTFSNDNKITIVIETSLWEVVIVTFNEEYHSSWIIYLFKKWLFYFLLTYRQIVQ